MKIKLRKRLSIFVMGVFFVSCGSTPDLAIPVNRGSTAVLHQSISLPRQKPYRSLEGASKGLAAWERYLANQSEPQAAFFTAHCETVRTLVDWIKGGKFHDNASMLTYTVAFAEECRKGVTASYYGRRCPESWRYFALANRAADTDVITSLLLGINAHINHDLTYAVINEGIDPLSLSNWEDHQTALDALMESSPRLRHQIAKQYLPSKMWMNDLFGWYIDYQLRRMFTISRNRAWNNAARIKSAGTKAEREKISIEIEQQSILIAQQIIALKGRPVCQMSAITNPE